MCLTVLFIFIFSWLHHWMLTGGLRSSKALKNCKRYCETNLRLVQMKMYLISCKMQFMDLLFNTQGCPMCGFMGKHFWS